MLTTNVTYWTCDHCDQKRKCVRIEVTAEDGGRLPFLSIWICAECLRRLATFTDRSR